MKIVMRLGVYNSTATIALAVVAALTASSSSVAVAMQTQIDNRDFGQSVVQPIQPIQQNSVGQGYGSQEYGSQEYGGQLIESRSNSQFDFAPPNTEPRQNLETQLGSGMTQVVPRQGNPSQIGNFVSPNQEMQGSLQDNLQIDLQNLSPEIEPGNLQVPGIQDGDEKTLVETNARIEIIRERYPDGKVQIMREVTQDRARNYFNHGRWQLFDRRGEVIGAGEYHLGLMEGQWQRLHPAGAQGIFGTAPFNEFKGPFLSSAEFTKGKMNGVWSIKDRFKESIFEMPYQDGKRNGVATWYHPNGKRMRECMFRDGLLEGPLFEWDKQEKLIRKEEYIKGRKIVSDVQLLRPKQKLSESFYLDPTLELQGEDSWWEATPAPFVPTGERVQHGPTGEWHSNGQPKLQGQYVDGLRQGTFVGWHSNGQKEVYGSFDKGEKSGTWTWWHPNGFKSIEGRYENDEPVGDWTWWNDDGTVDNKRDMTQQSVLRVGEEDDADKQPSDAIEKSGEREEVEAQELPPKSDREDDEEGDNTESGQDESRDQSDTSAGQGPTMIDIPEDVIPYDTKKVPLTEPISEQTPQQESSPTEIETVDPFEKQNEESGSGLENSSTEAEEVEAIPVDDSTETEDPIHDPFGDKGN